MLHSTACPSFPPHAPRLHPSPQKRTGRVQSALMVWYWVARRWPCPGGGCGGSGLAYDGWPQWGSYRWSLPWPSVLPRPFAPWRSFAATYPFERGGARWIAPAWRGHCHLKCVMRHICVRAGSCCPQARKLGAPRRRQSARDRNSTGASPSRPRQCGFGCQASTCCRQNSAPTS